MFFICAGMPVSYSDVFVIGSFWNLPAYFNDNRGWNGWIASQTQWTWVWASSRSWWWTGKPSMLQSMGPQRVGHDWVTELNWKNSEWGWIIYSIAILLTNLLMSFKDLIGLNQKSCLLAVSLIIDEISMLQAEIVFIFLGYIGKRLFYPYLVIFNGSY